MTSVLSYMPNGLKWHLYTVRGMPVEEARANCVEHVLECGARALLFIDDDTFLPENAINLLWSSGRSIVSGVTFTKSDPSYPCVFREDGAGPWLDLYKQPEGQYPIDAAGLSCCLIRREVLEKTPTPHFKWHTEEEGDGASVRTGEDTYFFSQTRKAGFQPYVDTRVLCLHADTVIEAGGKLSGLKMYPSRDVVESWVKR